VERGATDLENNNNNNSASVKTVTTLSIFMAHPEFSYILMATAIFLVHGADITKRNFVEGRFHLIICLLKATKFISI
jgi:hypothetical protein